MPTAVAPEGLQTQQGLIAGSGPELTCAFEAALVLAAGRFNCPGAQGLIGLNDLLWGGRALRNGLSGVEDVLVFHAVGVVFEVFDLGLEFFLFGFLQAGFEFGQAGNDGAGLVVADLLE